jgi:hypothetical protein
MKSKVKNKQFDCVKMKNDIQAKIYKKIKEMSGDEMLAFFNSPENRVVFGK